MSESIIGIDTYRQEAEELLADIEETIMVIEENPDDREAVNRLFRSMHTIKGSGAMFGFDEIVDFTHHLEEVLEKVQNNTVPVTKKLIDLILASCDQVTAMLKAADGGPPADASISENIIASITALSPESAAEKNASSTETETSATSDTENNEELTYRIRFRPYEDIFMSGTDPASLLDEMRELGKCTPVAQSDEIPPLGEMDAERCYFFWDVILSTTASRDTIKDVFIFVEDDSEISIETIADEFSLETGEANRRVGDILVERGDVSQAEISKVVSQQKRIGELLVEESLVSSDKVKSALTEQKAINSQQATQEAKSIRVAADKLDSLVDLVGELVTVQARLNQEATSRNDPRMLLISEEVERLTNELRDNTMSIRMLPIGTTFSKFKRLVRDLSNSLGKEIAMTTDGGDTELDKTVIERLNDPLVHIIRNSIDHGIELPDTREAAGKTRQGTIHLSAVHSGAHVLIRIQDDGIGLDIETIRTKALEKGLIAQDAELSDKECFGLIFEPGFSTAKKVTDVSGRGVGMDVVKRSIDALRGTIEVNSQRGLGTTITLKIPLTLAIIDGLLVTVGETYYIFPLAAITECMELTDEYAGKSYDRNILNLRNEALSYHRLREVFNKNGNRPEVERTVIAEVEGGRVGFVVDHIVGLHQTVIKTLGNTYRDVKGVSGASILGDGTVALILDLPQLVKGREIQEGQA